MYDGGMKKVLIVVAVVVVAGIAYYAISPLFNNIEVDDVAPVAVDSTDRTQVPSGFDNLSPEDQQAMTEQMEEANNGEQKVMVEDAPEAPTAAKVSEVMGTIGHPASGTVRVIQTADGPVARFEDFSTINGPRLNVYLAKDLDANEYIDLGPIKGTRGNINYELPDDVDLSEYKYIMHWCVPFGVLFNFADVSPN